MGNNLVGVGKTSHTTHDAEDVVVSGVDADLSGLDTTDGSSRDDELKSSVVDSGEIASAGWLVLLRAKCEREDVNTSVGVASVVLVRLDEIEVSSFALREAILAVQLKFGSDDWVLTPAVHVKGSLGKDKDAGIRDTTCGKTAETCTGGCTENISSVGGKSSGGGSGGYISIGCRNISSETVSEKTIAIDYGTSIAISRLVASTESKDGIRESINGIRVVKWLGTEGSVKSALTDERITVSDVKVRLDYPNKFLARVVEIEFDLVGR